MWFPPQYFDGLLGQDKTQVVIFKAQYQHEKCHEEEAHELWMIQCPMILMKANNSKPVPRDSGAKCNQSLYAWLTLKSSSRT
jgi:hypothetical protein